ncbi:MAG: ATP phosphoribosyltransferase regulatory subunit [Deferribacterales bacterium]|nr:ATP phosphoribosyltransferase regulatory subunit [Deferribacterales bacterium]
MKARFKAKSEPAQDRSRRRARLTESICRAISSYGYMELDLPVYEHYGLLKETAYDFSEESVIRFTDRNTGKTLVLRPDFTPQVCRAVTGYMGDYPLPLRLYYRGGVFRTSEGDRGHKTEKYQIGWELFGGGELCGDTEMVLSANGALRAVDLDGFVFVVGDAMFLRRLFSLTGDSWALKTAVAGKKLHDIKSIAAGLNLSKELTELLYSLPSSFGGLEVIEALKPKGAFDEILSARLDYMAQLFNTLTDLGISNDCLVFDASETKGLGYYTGVNFDIVHSNAGFSLGGGGRYDNLMDKFGKSLPACGMALHIEELMEFGVCSDDGQRFDYLVTGWHNLGKAQELRQGGFSVFFAADGSMVEEYKKVYKFKNIISG